MAKWTTRDMPSQAGRLAVVTGATSGLGLEVAKALVVAGATVILASRSVTKGKATIAAIRRDHPAADVSFEVLDTASLASIRGFADRWEKSGRAIDLLVLDAGISNVPTREVTEDGFERQFATNYLGHFALTGLLVPKLRQTAGTRIVAVASLAHKRTHLALDDLQLEQGYTPMRAYAQSKLALLTFVLELDRRLKQAHSPIAAVAAHPGVSTTGIVRGGGRASAARQFLARLLFTAIGQPPARGALPILYAGTASEARRGGYYGPDGWGERRGYPAEAKRSSDARDPALAAALWALSEAMTGVRCGEIPRAECGV